MSLFITATDTDAGKTFVTTAILKACLNTNKDAIAIKPIQSGCQNGVAPDVKEYEKVNPRNSFKPLYALNLASSPHLAARLENLTIDLDEIYKYYINFKNLHETVIVEGAGGVFVPLNENETMLDLIKLLNLPTVLVAPNRLGSINHTLLTIKALEDNGVEIALLVLNLSNAKDEICSSNIEYLRSKFSGDIVVLSKDETVETTALKFENFILNFNHIDEKIDLEFDKKHLFHPYTSSISPLKTYGVKTQKVAI